MKKLLSVVLIISILLSLLAGFPITVYANPYIRDVTWNGKWANCTYWAWQYAYEYDGVALPKWGDAKYWYDGASSTYPCDKTPAAHSIMCTGSGDLGYVAYVTDYNSATGKVYIKQGGVEGTIDGRSEGWQSAYPNDLQGYIHLGELPDPPEFVITATPNGNTVDLYWTDIYATSTVLDVGRANSHAKGVKLFSAYELQCADVAKKDGMVTAVDVAKINSRAKGVTSLW